MSRRDARPPFDPIYYHPLFFPSLFAVGGGALLIGLQLPRPLDRPAGDDVPACCVHHANEHDALASPLVAPMPSGAPLRLTIELPDGWPESTTLAVDDRPEPASPPDLASVPDPLPIADLGPASAPTPVAEAIAVESPDSAPLPILDAAPLVASPPIGPSPRNGEGVGGDLETSDGPTAEPSPTADRPRELAPESALGLASEIEEGVSAPSGAEGGRLAEGPTPGRPLLARPAEMPDPREAVVSGAVDRPSPPATAEGDDLAPAPPVVTPVATVAPEPVSTPPPAPIDPDRARLEARMAEVLGPDWEPPVPAPIGSGRTEAVPPSPPAASPATSALVPGPPGDAMGEVMTQLAGKVLRPYGSPAPESSPEGVLAEAAPVDPWASKVARRVDDSPEISSPWIPGERPLPDPSLVRHPPSYDPAVPRPSGDAEVIRTDAGRPIRRWWSRLLRGR